MDPKHSFGGSRLDRFVYDFDPDDDPAADDPAADLDIDDDPDAQADTTGAGDGEELEPDGQQEPASWAGPSREEWEAQQQRLAQLSGFAPVLDRLGQAIQKADDDSQPDPLADVADLSPLDDGYTGKLLGALNQVFGQLLDERLGPVNEIVGEKAEQEAKAQVDEMIEHAAKPHGDLIADDSRNLVEMLAYGVMVNEKTDGPTAIPKAAELVAGLVKRSRQEGRDQLLAEQKRRADAARDGGGQGGAAIGVDASGVDEMGAARRFMERRSAAAS